MLVLSRKSGEAVYIGSSIKISVLDIKGGRVRLGLAAPPTVPIHREEIRRQIKRVSENPLGDDLPGDAGVL
jgi:carbon storage regulator